MNKFSTVFATYDVNPPIAKEMHTPGHHGGVPHTTSTALLSPWYVLGVGTVGGGCYG